MARVPLTVLPALLVPLAAVGTGVWVYRDAKTRGGEELAPYLATAVGGAFLAGGVPGLVALAVAGETTTQGFPTALRVVPGFALLGAYLLFRDRLGT